MKLSYGKNFLLFFVFAPSSNTQGLLAGTKWYFGAKVYFKSWWAPGNLFLTNQFQKRSNSVPLMGQKKIFFYRFVPASSPWVFEDVFAPDVAQNFQKAG